MMSQSRRKRGTEEVLTKRRDGLVEDGRIVGQFLRSTMGVAGNPRKPDPCCADPFCVCLVQGLGLRVTLQPKLNLEP